MIKKAIFLILVLGFSSGLISARPGGQRQNKKKPNIIVILADDLGYSDIGCFGSETRTPNLDEMAAKGLRMTQFYNSSRCCPSRASLLTGLYPHQAGVGDMMNTRKEPAYQGFLNKNCVTIAEALKPYGYATFMAGKWHVGQDQAHWPLQRGFDRYFGLIDGAGSYFGPYPYRANQQLTIALDNEKFTSGKGYYSTDAYTDHAIQFITENQQSGKPFFLYLAYQAPHWPLQALPEDIAKYKGKYMQGWNQLRKERFQRMQQSGILNARTQLSPLDARVPAWESLSSAEKVNWDDQMAVYAAMIDRMDQNIGRIRQKLKEMQAEDNTVILFLSDNGASHETINPKGFLPEIYERSKLPSSDPNSFTAYGFPGANLSNTPFRMFKHWEYEGGNATPFIAYGLPLVQPGRTLASPAHLIDLMPTCLELAGGVYPKRYAGHEIKAARGQSLVPLFAGKAWKGHDALFFEHEGNKAVRKGKWKLVANYPDQVWHLYNMDKDRSELTDLAAKNAELVRKLSAMYDSWAIAAEVIPFEKLASANKQSGTNEK